MVLGLVSYSLCNVKCVNLEHVAFAAEFEGSLIEAEEPWCFLFQGVLCTTVLCLVVTIRLYHHSSGLALARPHGSSPALKRPFRYMFLSFVFFPVLLQFSSQTVDRADSLLLTL